MRLKKDSGWKRFEKAIDPKRFEEVVRRNIRQASIRNGKLAEAFVRAQITAGRYAKNANLTVMIKGSSKPLVDHGDLFRAVTSVVVDDYQVFIGIVRSEGEYNLAVALHEGVEIRVTPAMRGLFFVLWQASIGQMSPGALTGRAAELWERHPGGWKPLSASTNQIVIPGRPFIEAAFKNGELKRQATANWNMALKKAMRELSKQ